MPAPGAAVGPARVRAAEAREESRNAARRGRRNQHRHSMHWRVGDELGPADRGGGQPLVYCLRPRLKDREPAGPRGTRRDRLHTAMKAPRWSCRSDNSCCHTVHSKAVRRGTSRYPLQIRQKTDHGFTLNPIGMMVPAIGFSFSVGGDE